MRSFALPTPDISGLLSLSTIWVCPLVFCPFTFKCMENATGLSITPTYLNLGKSVIIQPPDLFDPTTGPGKFLDLHKLQQSEEMAYARDIGLVCTSVLLHDLP